MVSVSLLVNEFWTSPGSWLNCKIWSVFYILRHVSAAKLLHGMVFGCITWSRKINTAAENGLFYGWTTESTCMTACLMSPSCAAIDLGPVGCVLHNASDLTTTYYAVGVTLFILNRNCLSPRPLTTERPFTSITSDTVRAGKSWKLMSFILPCYVNPAMLTIPRYKFH